MIWSFCKSCGTESPGEVCGGCGKRAAAGALMEKWSVSSLPLRDGRVWRGAALALGGAAGLLMLTVFGLEAMYGGPMGVNVVWQGAFFRLTLAAVAVGLAAVFLFLLLQGRETYIFTLDSKGARQETWIGPQKWKSWARLQNADPARNIIQPDGSLAHLSQEKSLLWREVAAVNYQPQRGVILLYPAAERAPLALRLPAEEYGAAESWIRKYCKGK